MDFLFTIPGMERYIGAAQSQAQIREIVKNTGFR